MEAFAYSDRERRRVYGSVNFDVGGTAVTHIDGNRELQVVVIDGRRNGVDGGLPLPLLGVAAGAVVQGGARFVGRRPQREGCLEQPQGLRCACLSLLLCKDLVDTSCLESVSTEKPEDVRK